MVTPSMVAELRRTGMLSGGEPQIAPWEVPRDTESWIYRLADGEHLYVGLVAGRLLRDRRSVSARGILNSFVSLVGAGWTRVLRFARRFGPLELHEEGVPGAAIKNARRFPAHWEEHRDELEAIPSGLLPITKESISAYTRYARLAVAVLRLAQRLQHASDDEGVRAEVDDLRVIEEHWRWWDAKTIEYQRRFSINLPSYGGRFLPSQDWSSSPVVIPSGMDHLITRGIIEEVVNWWLQTSFAGVVLRSSRMQWEVVADPGGAWGAIGLCIAHAIRRGANTAVCHHCGEPVARNRRPAMGRRSWCQRKECQRVKWREEKRRRRA